MERGPPWGDMQMTDSRRAALAATIAFFFPLLSGHRGLAQEATDVCLKNGVRIQAARIETRDGKFFLYPSGAASPIELGPEQIRSIGDAAACGGTPPPPPLPVPIPVSDPSVARFGVHGSNTIGERLMPMIMDAYSMKTFGAPATLTPVAPEEMTVEFRSGNGSRIVAAIDFQAKGSNTAPTALKARRIAIGMMSRRMKTEEAEDIKAALNVDPQAQGSEHVVALDGLAVIVNPDNPVRKMTLEQIASVFAGEIANWKDVRGRDADGHEVAGPDRAISLHARDNKSGTFDTFKALVLEREGPKRKLAPQAARYESSEALSDAVAKDQSAIGFIGFPYINQNHALDMTSDCGLSHTPSKFAVKTEEYPLARRLYLYTLGAPAEPVARNLLQYALSDEAQKTVVDAGFIDQAIEFEDENEQKRWADVLSERPQTALPEGKEIPASSVRAFAATMREVRRSSLVFRFAYGESDLDIRALQDVERLGRHLKRPEFAGRRFYIVGFADSDGSWAFNMHLAAARAYTVAKKLQGQGVRVPRERILALSYMAPVACNDSEAGRARNRRVELWITR